MLTDPRAAGERQVSAGSLARQKAPLYGASYGGRGCPNKSPTGGAGLSRQLEQGLPVRRQTHHLNAADIDAAAISIPFVAAAQQRTPLVGFLNSASPETYRFNADSFREGLAKAGFIEGRNVRIEERWARGDYAALPALAADLVSIGVAAIAATGDVASARAAQQASSTVPVVFTIGGTPFVSD